jgi:septal ring factor EnvC (AmiA/AmiB activator)
MTIEKRVLEARLKLQADTEVELKLEKELQTRIDVQAKTVDQEVNNASEYIHECEEKVEYTTRKSLELLRQLKEAETEIETLKHYIIELKQRIAVYIPVKEDAIDRKSTTIPSEQS